MNGLDREDEIVAAYANGWDVETIESHYGVTREQVERIVAGDEPDEPVEVVVSWRHSKGNRAALGGLVGFVVAIFGLQLGMAGLQQLFVWAGVGIVVYALTSPN